jgi:hypothetical protein
MACGILSTHIGSPKGFLTPKKLITHSHVSTFQLARGIPIFKIAAFEDKGFVTTTEMIVPEKCISYLSLARTRVTNIISHLSPQLRVSDSAFNYLIPSSIFHQSAPAMPSTQNKVLVVVAAGPLIGVAVSTLFIVKGFTHVALISRSLSRLSEDVNLVLQRAKESGNSDAIVKAYVGDVLNPENITSILKQIEADLGAPEVVVYNAAVISRGGLGDFTEEELVEEFKVRRCHLF